MLVIGGAKGWFGGNLGFRRFGKRLRWRFWFSTTRRAVRMRIWFPAARAWGAPLPYTPSGDGVREGCDPLALSRGLLRREFRFPTMQETASVEMPVFGGAKRCSDEDFVSDDAGVGRSAPLHPLGGRGVRGLRPSHALPGLGWREFRFPTMQETASVEMLVFGDVKGCSFEDFGFRRRERGALRSPTPPRVTGCERVATLSRSLVGVGWREFGFPTVQRRFSGGRVVFSSKWERLPASAETGFGRF